MKPRAFTLIELLVDIAIIGLLSSVVLASLNTARSKARDAVRESNLTNLQQALAMYSLDHNGAYPVASTWNAASPCVAWNTVSANSIIPGLVPTYIGSIPVDPAAGPNVDCLLYVSDGTDYKILDYIMNDSLNPGAQPTLIDPTRNNGKSYTVTTSASSPCWAAYNNISGGVAHPDTNISWAVWSSSNSMCW